MSLLETESPQQLKMFPEKPMEAEAVAWFVGFLQGKDWTTAGEVLKSLDWPDTERHKRWIRSLAAASKGAIAGGQSGYKLVKEMTAEEYQHFRNWMKHQADEMTRRILTCDKVFYARQAVHAGNGILEAEAASDLPS